MMRKKSGGTHEKQIRSMRVLFPTRDILETEFDLNQTVISSEKVSVKSQSRCLIRIGFHSIIPNGRRVAGFFNEIEK
jgi:hypothetical protein